MEIDVHKYYDIVVQNWFKDVSYKAVRKIYFEFPIDEPREIFPPSINNFDSEKKLIRHLSLMLKELFRTQHYKKAKKELLNAKSE